MKTTNKTHGRFYSLLRQMPRRGESAEQLKNRLVSEYSQGGTTSLNDLYKNYPQGYENMIQRMKKELHIASLSDVDNDLWRKRVIAAICAWMDATDIIAKDKVKYAMSLACRAANCSSFNSISQVRLAEIYNTFIKRKHVACSALREQELEELLALFETMEIGLDNIKANI